jgi:hypothetical protein
MGFREKSLMIFANRMMKGVGHIQELHINTKDKSCSGVALLAGETQPIEVEVGKYAVVEEGSKATLQLRDVTCSKEWMEKLAGRLEPQMNIELSPAIVSVLRLARVI